MQFLYVPIFMIVALAAMSAVDVIFHRKVSRKQWRDRGIVTAVLAVLVILWLVQLRISGGW